MATSNNHLFLHLINSIVWTSAIIGHIFTDFNYKTPNKDKLMQIFVRNKIDKINMAWQQKELFA